jgi:hypothetical protein
LSEEQGSFGDRPDGEDFEHSDFEDAEIVDGVPVLAGAPRIIEARDDAAGSELSSTRSALALPAVQAAAVAAGSFVAGAAVLGLVHRRQRHVAALGKGRRAGRELGRRSRTASRAGELVQVVGSRSFLVDVHLLGGSGADR